MSYRDRGLASRAFDLCVGVLLAAMSLWGAVQIVKSIWLPLCIGLGVVFVTAGIALLISRRFTRW